jgi:LL-diaminopimelate aminotransferase
MDGCWIGTNTRFFGFARCWYFHPEPTTMMKISLFGCYVVLVLLAVAATITTTTAFQPLQQQPHQQRRPVIVSKTQPQPRITSKTALAVVRNANFAKLAGGYLFPEIGRRRTAYALAHPEQANRIISLGIGDTTLPIPPHILSGLEHGATKLGTPAGYTGYGDVQGRTDLREKIARTLYKGIIEPDEVFVTGTLLLNDGMMNE